MSSRAPSSGGLKVPRRGKASATTQYLLLGVVAIIVLLVVLLVVQGMGRKSTAGSTRVSRSRGGGATVTEEGVESRSRRPSRRERSAERRAGRPRKRSSERTSVGRTAAGRTRSSRSATPYGTSSRRSNRQSGVPVLNGTDGTTTAVFSTRVVRKGEEIDGRRVVEVGQSSVIVEYRNERYQVKVGEPLYRP